MKNPVALIIEDEKNVAEFYAFALDEVGYETIICLNGRTAFEKLEEYQPQLIILDMRLPDANGQDILNQIRQDPRNIKSYVILATGQPQMIDKQLNELANFVLVKPIEYSQFLTLVQRIYRSLQD